MAFRRGRARAPATTSATTTASTDRLARRRTVTLTDFLGRTLRVDPCTGTSSEHLWPARSAPVA